MTHNKDTEEGGLEPIAICGMACRLPGGVDSASSLWSMLLEKRTGQTPKVPKSRFNIDAYLHENLDRPGSFNVSGGYFLDGKPEDFDPTAFGMTPIEAQWLDPQQRRMLEVSYECIESAGIPLEKLAGSNTAVFIGSFTSDYQQMSIRDPDFRHNYAATGVDPGIISNRIGNAFNLNGPSFTINTACSSSVYAIHNACHALRARDCVSAIAGGVNLIMTVDQHMNTAKLGILSPTSTCHTFDASADGYGRAEGAGALFLKRLSDAIRDGDPIRGVIRSTAVNTNGRVDGMGITHPSVKGQELVVRKAYRRANLDPNKTTYAELHGTGTPVGDPIETRATANAMNDTRSKSKPLLVGAIKPNIGHSEAASGIFAVMKAAMMTETAKIPGVALFKNINPNIKEEEWNVKVNVDTIPWPENGDPRRASVSSFGYGGTNGHVIVEAVESLYPGYQHAQPKSATTTAQSDSRAYLLTFSAHDKPTLSRNVSAIAGVASNYQLDDLAYTLNARRTKYANRAFSVVRSGMESAACQGDALRTGTALQGKLDIGYLFTGQGAQWAGMGQVALKEFPSFRTTIRGLDKVLSTLVPRPELNIENLLLGDVSTTRELFNRAEVAQPLCTAIQIALVDLLAEWGLAPTVSVGHSSGEIGAAYSAGLLSAPQAILAAYCRGMAVKEKAPAGTMLAVGLGVTEVEQYIRDYEGISIACENSPASVTLSGLSEHISAIEAIFDKKDIFARELKTGRAYHSPHMSEVGALYEEKITAAFETLSTADNSWKRPRRQMISSVNVKSILVDELQHSYWSDNLRGRVMFDTAVSEFGTSEDYKSVRCIVEIGPHAALAGPFKQIRQAKKLDHMVYTPSLARNSNDVDQILSIAGSLFLQGYPINLEKVNASGSEVRAPTAKTQANKVLVDLPPYQWNYGKRYWAEPRPSAEIRQLTHARHDILGTKVAGLSSTCQIWRNILRHRDIPWLQDHKLGGSAIFPAAGHMALAIEALSQTLELEEDPRALQSVTLRDVDIRTALVIPDTDTGVEIILRFWKLTSQSAGSQWYKFEVESLTDGQWTVHCDGTISANYKNTISLNTPVDRTRLTQKMTGKRWYEAFDRVGFHYGNTFNQLQSVRTDRKLHHATGDVLVTQSTKVMTGESRYVIHPSTVDACLQLIIISIHQGKHKEMPYGVVPTRIEEATLFMPKQEDMTVGDAVAWTDNIDGRYYNTHAKLVGHSGNALLEIQSLRCVAYEAAIPVGTSTKRSAAPVSGTYWKPDVRALRQSSFTELLQEPANLKEATSKLIELGDHHHPASKMLIRGSLDSPIVCSALAAVGNDVAIFACSDIDDLTELKQDSANGLTVDTWEALSADTYDIVVADEQGSSNGASLISRLNANGVFLAAPADAKAFGNIPSLQLETSSSKLLATHGSFIQQQNGNSYEKVQVLSTGEEDVTELVASLEAHNLKVFSTPLEAFAPQENTYLIISDIAGKLYDSLDETKFEKLKAALLAGLPTLWITKGAQEGSNVGAGIAQGFLRVVRSEQIASKITLLDADSCESFAKISEVAVDLLNKSTANDEDIEFWLHQGQLYIPRVHPNDNVNQEVSPSGEIEATAVPRAVKLVGELVDNQMLFKEMPTDLASDAVEIQVLASKKISTSSRSPNTVCGTVIRTGESLDKSLVGQKVVALTSESFTTIVCSSIFAVVDANVDYCRLAAEVSTLLHAIAAGANAAQITSRERVSLLPGPKESIKALIQASAAFSWDVQLVIPYGSSKATYSAELGLRDDAALEVRYVEPTSNDAQDQPDVIVAHDFSIQSQEAWRTIKSHGRFILADSPSTISPDPLPFGRAASFLVADPASLLSGDQASASCALQKSLEIFHSNRGFGPWVLSLEVVDIASITSAPEAQRSSSSVIEYRYGESQVKIQLPSTKLKLSSEDTYLLVGCLGGLGRSLTTFMMERGARHFSFISRSGADKPEAADIVQSLQDNGAEVTIFRADAGDEKAVREIVAELQSKRPIRGVVHAAMVLQDGLFELMDFNGFQAAMGPKVRGAISLHNAFAEQALDFFVMTSSISAVLGNPGQANYSAANSFLDTLAYHRNSRGLAATSLVLPMVLDVGVVAENSSLEVSLTRKGLYGIDEHEMLRGFEVSMTRPIPAADADVKISDSQLILGLETEELATALATINVSDAYWYNDTRLSHVRHRIEGQQAPSSGSSGSSFEKELQAATEQSLEAAYGVIADHIAKRVSGILMIPTEDFELDGPSIASYGLDSMIGAEMRTWIFKEFGVDYPFQELLAPTLSFMALAKVMGAHLGLEPKAALQP